MSSKPILPRQASRMHALDRLQDFLPRAGRIYAETRNSDLGPHDRSNVSTLSPWIRHRLVLEEEVIDAVLRQHSFSRAQKFLQEVFWRTYFKGWLEQRPLVWQRYCTEVKGLADELANNDSLRRCYDRAVQGRTGIDCMDTWVNELVETGYLHNHARMWLASIWIFTLKLPWQLGADFFLRHLLDGDPASNTLSWRWVAGLHTRGKTYLARSTNIEKFTNGRFNPVGQLSAEARPISETDVGPPIALPPPEPIDIDAPFLLLVTKEDCSPEALNLRDAPEALLGLAETGTGQSRPVSAQVRRFSSDSIEDALGRCALHFGVTGELHETDTWTEALKAHAQQAGVNTIATAYAPVGPTADRLKQAGLALCNEGIQIVQLRRDFDTTAWPHATKGFFALKKKIPEILSTLDRDA